MFKGPTRDSVMQGVGPFFSTLTGTSLTFGGGAITEPERLIGGAAAPVFVGTGQQLIFYLYEDFAAPTNPTDVKWIEIAPYFYTSPSRIRDVTDPLFSNRRAAPTELVSSRDPRNPGTQIAERRWRITRLPVLNDPDNQHPFGTFAAGGGQAITAFEEKAINDFMVVSVRFVALDRDVDPVVPADRTFEFGYVFGGYARG